MRAAREEEPSRNKKVINLILAVKELHGLSSQELDKLIKDLENNTIQWTSENGSPVQMDVEKLARYLPVHLIARLISVERDEASFRYLLCGFQLLYSLCEIASQHPNLEKVLLDDVKVSVQLLDLVIYTLIVLGGLKQKHLASTHTALLNSALVTCSLYLMRVCISSQWQDLVQVILAHPKVDIFMSVAFAAVRVNIQFLQVKLSDEPTVSCTSSNSCAEETLKHLSQHCEASIQFLLSLCQQKMFRERVVRNRDLCGKGGVLLLAQDIMKVHIFPTFKEPSLLAAAISRLEAKVLSILLHLCEVESISYLDEVADTDESLSLAKSVALEVIALLKKTFGGDLEELSARSNNNYPKGILQLNAMRFIEILSDDSNFRSHITIYFTEVLSGAFSVSHGEFLRSWCSSELPVWEEDATLEFNPIAAAGWVLDTFSSADDVTVRNSEPTFKYSHVPRASYAYQRTSLMVKVIANLHCHVPEICKEEKDLFLTRFLNIMKTKYDHQSDGAETAIIICRNLCSLLSHAESLIPEYLNEDDAQLLRVFISQIEPLIAPQVFGSNRVQDSKFEDSTPWGRLSQLHISEQHQEAQNIGGCSSLIPRNSSSDNEDMSDGSAVEEVCPFDAKGINGADRLDKGVGPGEVQQEKEVERTQREDKQQRKRKRTIMNDKQVSVIEKALADEPEMQRKKVLIDAWANKLSRHGSEVTPNQLKNWLNNRKARLARAAAKDVRGPSGVNDAIHDSPESPVEDLSGTRLSTLVQPEPGQYVGLLNEQGEEIGNAYVYQVKGTWSGKKLEESGTSVVDITNLEVDKWMRVPYPSEATGTSFAQAEKLLGRMRVLWDSNKLFLMQQSR